MTILLTASSPMEIEAEVDEKGLDRQVREVALGLFHDLTSRLELASLNLAAVDQRAAVGWPAHRFYFGPSGGDLARLLAVLQERPDALRVAATVIDPPRVSGGAAPPGMLFIDGVAGPFAAVLVACADPEALRSTAEALGRR